MMNRGVVRVGIIVLIISLFVGVIGVSAAQSNPGTGSLIGWWSMDEMSGVRVDSHNNNNLGDVNSVGYQGGIKALSSQFNQSLGNYLSAPDDSNYSMGDISFSVCGWSYVEDLGVRFSTVAKWGQTGNQREYGIYYNQVNDRYVFVLSSNGSTVTTLTSDVAVSVDTWYFVCGWHDSVNDMAYISVNLETPVSASHAGGVFDGTSAFRVGNFNNGVLGYGRVDEVVLYKKILTDGNREFLYNDGFGRGYCDLAGNCETSGTYTATSQPSTSTFTPTATDTSTPTATDTATSTSTGTLTPTATDTLTPTATETPLVTETVTPLPTSTPGTGLPPDGFLGVDWINYAVSMGLLLLGYPLYALVWILMVLFVIPEDYLGLSALVLFFFIIYRKFLRGAS